MLYCLGHPGWNRGPLSACLLANKSTAGVPHHLYNLWLPRSLSFTPELSCPWHLPGGLPHPWGNLDILLPHSCDIWLDFPCKTILSLAMSPFLIQQIGYCCCVVYLEGDGLPYHYFLNFHIVSGSTNLIGGCSCPSLQATCLWMIGCSYGLHSLPWGHLLWLPHLLWVCILILVMVWRCATNAGLELPLLWASAPWTERRVEFVSFPE